MKKISLVSFLSVTLSPAIVLGEKMLKGAIYSPEQGVICDKKSGFCADNMGISMGFTKDFLGEAAQKKMLTTINSVKDFDLTWFTFSNGVSCKTKEKVCYTSKFEDNIDQEHTKALFGGSETENQKGQHD